MSNRRFIILGAIGIAVALATGALALWLVIAAQ